MKLAIDKNKSIKGVLKIPKSKDKYKFTNLELDKEKLSKKDEVIKETKKENLYLNLNVKLKKKFSVKGTITENEKIRKAITENLNKQDNFVDYEDFEFLNSNLEFINDLYQETGFVYKISEDIINELDITQKDKVIMYNIVNCLEKFAMANIIAGKTISIPHNGTISIDWKYLVNKDNRELFKEFRESHSEEEYKEYRKKVFAAGKERYLEKNNEILLNRSARYKNLDLSYKELLSTKPYRKFNAEIFNNLNIVDSNNIKENECSEETND